ncbi:hypothetical protein EV121DRAFT_274722 [Schizophyllum commune]
MRKKVRVTHQIQGERERAIANYAVGRDLLPRRRRARAPARYAHWPASLDASGASGRPAAVNRSWRDDASSSRAGRKAAAAEAARKGRRGGEAARRRGGGEEGRRRRGREAAAVERGSKKGRKEEKATRQRLGTRSDRAGHVSGPFRPDSAQFSRSSFSRSSSSSPHRSRLPSSPPPPVFAAASPPHRRAVAAAAAFRPARDDDASSRHASVVGDRALAFASSLVTAACIMAVACVSARLRYLVTYLDFAHYKLLPLSSFPHPCLYYSDALAICWVLASPTFTDLAYNTLEQHPLHLPHPGTPSVTAWQLGSCWGGIS